MFRKISLYGSVLGMLFEILTGCNEINTQKSASIVQDQPPSISTTSNPSSVKAESSNTNNQTPLEFEQIPKHSDLKGQQQNQQMKMIH